MSKKVAGEVQVGRNPHLWFSRDSDGEGQFSPSMPWFDRVRHVPGAIRGMGFPLILDVGSNSGGMGRLILETNPTATLYGVDLARHLLPRATEKGYKAVVQADAETLPFRSNFFDVVILSEILEHVNDPVAVVSEAHRVMVKGGMLLGDTPTWYGRWGYRSLYGHKWHRRAWFKWQLRRLLESKFVNVSIVSEPKRHPTFWVPQWYVFEARKEE